MIKLFGHFHSHENNSTQPRFINDLKHSECMMTPLEKRVHHMVMFGTFVSSLIVGLFLEN